MPGMGDLRLAEQKSTVYAKTSIGGWVFDAFFKLEHMSQLKITEFPISTGSSITDHAFMQPATLTIDVGMTDVAKPVNDKFAGSGSRSVLAFQILQQLQAARVPIQVTTRLKTYKNMLIETITVPDDYTTANALKATVVFKEIIVVNIKTVKLSAKPQVTNKTTKGKVEAVKPNRSIAYQAIAAMFGEAFAKSLSDKDISDVINGVLTKIVGK
jgi:hypothetical protein